MFAVIKTGGKQYLVREGQNILVEKLELEIGSKITWPAMMVADEAGGEMKVGRPNINGAKVEVEVVEQGRAKKVSVVKYKPKVRYRRNVGHRQPFTKIKIEKITV